MIQRKKKEQSVLPLQWIKTNPIIGSNAISSYHGYFRFRDGQFYASGCTGSNSVRYNFFGSGLNVGSTVIELSGILLYHDPAGPFPFFGQFPGPPALAQIRCQSRSS